MSAASSGRSLPWRVVKFGEMVHQMGERVDPAEADVYVGLEHLDPGCLHIREHEVPRI